MIKLVIFDLDGTLADAYNAVSSSVNSTLGALGFPARSYAEIRRSVGGGDRKLMAHFVGEKLADRAISIYRPHHALALRKRGGVKLLPGVQSVLKFLKRRGCKLAIASNRPTRFTRIILRVLKISGFFDAVLCADKISRPKPYPDVLWAIAARLKVDRAEVLYVGDMTLDVNCAHKAGVRMAAIATGSSSNNALKALKPWALIAKMSQIKEIIQKADSLEEL